MSRRNKQSGADKLKNLRKSDGNAPPPPDADQTPPPGPDGNEPNGAPPPPNDPPPDGDTAPNDPPQDDPPEPTSPSCVKLTLPLGDTPEGVYVSRHVDVQLNNPQARALRQLLEGLLDEGACLANGRRVTSAADAVRYLLDEIACHSGSR